MKKVSVLLILALFCFGYGGEVSPTLTLRFDDVLDAAGDGLQATTVIGLKMELADGVYTGFDSDNMSNRIYLERSFGKVGLGALTAGGNPYFTVGGTYSIMDNLHVELDYIVNRLIENVDDQLRLGLAVSF